MLLEALFIVVKKCKQPKYAPTNERINKMWYVHNNGILFSNKKEWGINTCYKLKNMLNEKSQT